MILLLCHDVLKEIISYVQQEHHIRSLLLVSKRVHDLTRLYVTKIIAYRVISAKFINQFPNLKICDGEIAIKSMEDLQTIHLNEIKVSCRGDLTAYILEYCDKYPVLSDKKITQRQRSKCSHCGLLHDIYLLSWLQQQSNGLHYF